MNETPIVIGLLDGQSTSEPRVADETSGQFQKPDSSDGTDSANSARSIELVLDALPKSTDNPRSVSCAFFFNFSLIS